MKTGFVSQILFCVFFNVFFISSGLSESLNLSEIKSFKKPEIKNEKIKDLLPQSRISYGVNRIKISWLSSPTGRYNHGILGDHLEAETLNIELKNRRIISLTLPENSVFEDLQTRIFDIDSDGSDEIAVVESHIKKGASLSFYALKDKKLVKKYSTPYLGRSHRWLNPLGFGDFDGDGNKDTALVATPHIGGILRLYRISEGKLSLYAERYGVSTHSIGSTEMDKGVVIHREKKDLILLPTQSGRKFLLLKYKNGGIVTVSNINLPGRISTSLVSNGTDRWIFRTDTGKAFEISVR